MMKFLLFLVILFSYSAFSQTITINGQYIDKNGNPIDSAKVIYLQEGLLPLDSSMSDPQGNFQLSILTTNIKQPNTETNLRLGNPAPNPSSTFFRFSLII